MGPAQRGRAKRNFKWKNQLGVIELQGQHHTLPQIVGYSVRPFRAVFYPLLQLALGPGAHFHGICQQDPLLSGFLLPLGRHM
jgi:hypothetical protein